MQTRYCLCHHYLGVVRTIGNLIVLLLLSHRDAECSGRGCGSCGDSSEGGRTIQQHTHNILVWREPGHLLLLFCLGLSGRAGSLPIKDNKLLGSLGYWSNPQDALLQAEWLGAEGEVGAIWPTPFRVWVHPPRRGAPDSIMASVVMLCYCVLLSGVGSYSSTQSLRRSLALCLMLNVWCLDQIYLLIFID